MDVSIIIVNYNTYTLLCQAIDSIFSTTKNINFEIIIVDNNSTDNSISQLLKRYGDKIQLISLNKNIGFGRANNKALEQVKGRNIFFCNPDTIFINNATKILSDYLDNNPITGIVGGNLYNVNQAPNASFNRILPSIFDELDQACFRILSKIRYGKSRLFNYTGKPLKVGYITGADLMTRKAILDKVGFFDPDFFLYYEETELTFRIKKAGYNVISLPDAHIIHLEGQSFLQNFDRELRALRSRKIYFRKTHSIFYTKVADINLFIITKIAYWVSILIRSELYKTKMEQRLTIIKLVNKK